MRRGRAFAFFVVAAFASLAARAEPDSRATTLHVPTRDGLAVVVGTSEAARKAYDLAARSAREGAVAPEALEIRKLVENAGLEGVEFVGVYFTREAVESFLTSRVKETTVREAEEEGLIPYIEGLDVWEAWLMLRAEGMETRILDEGGPEKEKAASHTVPVPIFALASTDGHGRHAILADGRDVSPDGTGYNVAVFSPDGTYMESKNFDTKFGADGPGAAARFAEYLRGLPEGSWIAAATLHGHGVFLSGPMLQEFRAFGGAKWMDPEIDRSHALVGRKGWAPGEAYESANLAAGGREVCFDPASLVKRDGILKLAERKGGAIAVLTSTSPESRLYLIR